MNTDSLDDQELWNRIKNGDRVSFERFYRKHIQRLYVLVSKRIDDQTVVEDLLQDIFLTLWEKRELYEPRGKIYPYLKGMATNRILNHYRENKNQPQYVDLWDNLPESIINLQELSTAFTQVEDEEYESLLQKAIHALPERMHQVYDLRFIQNQSIDQISSQLSISPHTVRNQIKNIRKKFLQTLKSAGTYLFF